jgi:hypothetical protein
MKNLSRKQRLARRKPLPKIRGLRVLDDSLGPKYKRGETIICIEIKRTEAKAGDDVVVQSSQLFDGKATLRRVVSIAGGKLTFAPVGSGREKASCSLRSIVGMDLAIGVRFAGC